MVKTFTYLTFLLFFYLKMPLVFGQGIIDGFMRGQGNTTVALSYATESYNTYYVNQRATVNPNLGTITAQSFNFFASTGLTDKLDVLVSVPYIIASSSAGYWQTQRGFQDGSLYLKYQPVSQAVGSLGNISIILAAGLSTPLADYIGDAPVAIGHQSTNLDGRLVGQFKTNFGLFLQAQGGYIRRSDVTLDREITAVIPENQGYYYGNKTHVPDAIDVSGKVGFASSWVYAEWWWHQQEARPGTNIGPGVPFQSNAISFTRTGFSLFYPLPFYKSLGISGGAAFTLQGKNIGKATRFSGSVVYNLPAWKKS